MRLSHLRTALLGATASLLLAVSASAGGTPENVILLIDPSDALSLYVGNYYKLARNIPDSNVFYIKSAAADFPAFSTNVLDAVLASLDQRSITDHADYMVLAPLDTTAISSASLVVDGCFPILNFSISSCYAMAFIRPEVLAGTLNQSAANRYFSTSDSAVYFDSSLSYLNGQISTLSTARRYFIGAMLGYTGDRGNTVPELLAMIDRSVAVDGSRPPGTFYFMNNTGDPVRNVRACGAQSPPFCNGPFPLYTTAANSIISRGGAAQVITSVLPDNRTDCLGIMTGTSLFDVAASGAVIRPGAFCDHLTSYGATFGDTSQSKVSLWIAAGASGSAGATEEPCNYTGKFPGARFHVFYYQGLSLGESYLRSIQFVPFQSLLYGDPLTRPFAYIPAVSHSAYPATPVSGNFVITPSATTGHPTAVINRYDLYVDGVFRALAGVGQSFNLNTTILDDGFHDVRVLAYDNSTVKSVGSVAGLLWTVNHGLGVTLVPATSSGDLAHLFSFSISATGGDVRELRLVQNGRVIAATTSTAGLSVFGQNLGAGNSDVHAEAVYTTNRVARSGPVRISVLPTGTPGAGPPLAFSYSKDLFTATNYIVELPASFDTAPASATYTLLSAPDLATLVNPGLTGPYRIIRPNAGATGSELITFRVTTPSGASNIATVTLNYTPPPPACTADWNTDGTLNSQDFFDFLNDFFANNADYNHSGSTNSQDFFDFLNDFFAGC